jgi:hypothetical protein
VTREEMREIEREHSIQVEGSFYEPNSKHIFVTTNSEEIYLSFVEIGPRGGHSNSGLSIPLDKWDDIKEHVGR